jgi:hypothetical protein
MTEGPHAGGFYHPDFKRNDKASCFLLRRKPYTEDRRMKKRSLGAEDDPQAKRRQKKNQSTKQNGEILSTYLDKTVSDPLLEGSRQPAPAPSLVQSSREYRKGGNVFEDALWLPMRNENVLVLSLLTKPIASRKNLPAFFSDPSTWHENKCLALEPRPIEEMIASS